MRRGAGAFACALLSIVLAGCATSRCPQLAPEVAYCLQPSGAAPRMTLLQEVVVTQAERVDTLLVQTENSATQLAVVGVSPLGQTLLSATWDGAAVHVKPVAPSFAPSPGAMLAFAQFGLMSFDELGAGFAADLHRARELREDGGTLFLRDMSGRTLIEIRRDGQRPPFARTRIQLPTIALDIQARALDPSPSAPASP